MTHSSLARLLAGLFLIGLAVAPLRAQEPPRFLIESIVVEGVSRAAGRQIVTDESLLKPGQIYAEPQLRQAVYRVKRLPFVVDAEFSLRKGSARGAYELVIKVEEATPVFFLAEEDAARVQQTDFFTGRKRTSTVWQRLGTLGGRMFVGSYGLAYGSVEKVQHQDGELVQAGYRQFDLFGSGSFANVELDSTQGVKGYDQLGVDLSGGIPLTAAQSLRIDVGWDRRKDTFGPPDGFSEDNGLFAAAEWVYNTTDDPLFPLSGTTGLAFISYRTDVAHNVEPAFDLDQRLTGRSLGYSAGGETFWPLTARQSLELGAGAGGQRFSVTQQGSSSSFQGNLIVGHAVNLWGYEKSERFGDLRFENFVVLDYVDQRQGVQSRKTARLTSSLLYRSRWGVLRASFTYDDLWRKP